MVGAPFAFAFVILALASYVTSFIHCIANGKILMLIVVIVFPVVGFVHGVMVWLGAVK